VTDARLLEVASLHDRAMEAADDAFAARRSGDGRSALEHFRRSFELEREAAKAVALDLSLEPSRAILHRSAATLALDCGEYREAQRLLAAGLAGNPPPEYRDELSELLLQVTRELEVLRGLRERRDDIRRIYQDEEIRRILQSGYRRTWGIPA